ncbi:MAG: hypothetical protein M3Y27_22570 [Acidobacteriota bacterium]|nr:hypothetical protein [Acidobacteriota bacterium]
MSKSLSLFAVACLLAITAAQGQNLFLVPGANSTSAAGAVISGNSLAPLGSFSAGAGAFQVVATPSGNKYYVIANSGSATITALDSNFSNPRSLGNLGLQATAAAITPDGRRLLVVAGTLHIIDTSSENDLTPNGLNPGTPLFDLAISLDGTKAFVLGRNPSGGSTLFSINLSNNAVIASFPIAGSASGVSVGPNSFVYVTTLNQLFELNPNTLTVTPGGLIPLNANPGKVAFTPDGRFGLVVNQTPITGSSIIVFDLASHTVFSTGLTPDNGLLDRLLVAGNNLVFAYSSQKQSLYQISLVPLAINPLSIPSVPNTAVVTAALSNEVAGGSRTTAQFLYFIGNNTLFKVDLAAGILAGQVPLATVSNVISIAGPANTSGVPATLLQYGNNQILGAGATSAPLVIRVLDGNGLPVSGVPVTFSSTTVGVSIQAGTVNTSPDGFAVSSAIAPTTSGIFTVTASVPGGQTVNFQLGVGGGAGGGSSSSLVTIVAGQGQIVSENFNTSISGFGSPLIVSVKDITGNPVVGAVVTFSVQGPGAVSSGKAGDQAGLTSMISTDANGLAAAAYLSQNINPGSGFQQAVISASAPGTNTVIFFITTTTQQPNGITAATTKPLNGDPPLQGAAGSTLKGAVTASAGSNVGPVPNVGIRLVSLDFNGNPVTDPSQGPFVSCADPNGTGVLTDMTGRITCDVVFGPKVGRGQFQVQLGYTFLSQPFPFVVTTGPPSAIKIVQGNNQTGLAGQTLRSAFAFQVTDAGGNPLSNVPVSFSVTPAGAVTLANQSSATDSNGNASALGTLGNIGGTATVRVTAGSATASFTVIISIPVGGVQPVSGDGQSTLVGTAFPAPLVVKVTDAGGTPVAGAQVAFVVTSGSASVTSATVTTNASGLASTTVNSGTNVGPISVIASSGGFATAFALTSRLPGPSNIMFLNGASFAPGLSPGSIVNITGTGIAPGVQGVQTPPGLIVGPLPTSLAGVQVLFNGTPAPIFFVSNLNGQESVAVQVPFELAPGTATVTIITPSNGSATINNVPVAQYSPGLFETSVNGQTLGVAIRPDGSYVTPSNPAQRGDVVCFFATGLGQVSPAASTNSTGVAGQNVTAPIDVGVNNGGVRLGSATYLPGRIGVYEVCLEIPIDTTPGPSQPIGLILRDTQGNPFFAQGTTIPIQ